MDGIQAYEKVRKENTATNRQLFFLFHKPYIFSIISKMMPQSKYEELEDITSEIFYILLKRSNIDFSRSYGEIKGYIGKTVVNNCTKIYRSKILPTTTLEDFEWNRIPQVKPTNIYTNIVDELLFRASKKEKTILMTYLEELNGVAAGKKLNYSRQYINQVLQRFGQKNKRLYKKLKEAV